jgi:hypothetical protein
MHVVDVKMNNVELIGAFENFLKHYKMMGKLILAFVVVQAEGFWAGWNQPRCRPGIAARKQGDLVPSLDQRLGQIGDYTLGTAVELWGHALVKRCYLGYSQRSSSP